MYLLGYDLGSSSIKAALVEATTHKVVLVQSYPDREMDMIAQQAGWAEQEPELWWENLCLLTKRLIHASGIKKTDIQAIGIAYQMHGLVVVDKHLEVLRPAIIWCDSRAVDIGRAAFQALGDDYCLGSLLNSPGNFTASKLKWIKDHEPDIFARIHKIMLPGDYIAMRLTGQPLSTVTGLSEGIFWDFKANTVAQKVLEHYGLDPDLLPDITPVFAPQGYLSPEAAEMTGLHTGVQVSYRAGDQPNNALALGVTKPGEVAASGGTSGVVYGIFDQAVCDPQSRINAFAHVNHSAENPRIGALLCINGAGSQYRWIKHHIANERIGYPEMEQLAATIPIGADGLRILPFGNGAERMLGDQNPGAHFLNLQFNRHSRAHLYRAALEGIAFSFAYGVQILKDIGLKINVLRVGNDNLFQSRIFANTVATLVDTPIQLVESTGAVGAARASGVATGAYKSIEEALDGIRPAATINPEASLEPLYAAAYQDWHTRLLKVL